MFDLPEEIQQERKARVVRIRIMHKAEGLVIETVYASGFHEVAIVGPGREQRRRLLPSRRIHKVQQDDAR